MPTTINRPHHPLQRHSPSHRTPPSLSISYYPLTRDRFIYPSPETFNPLRFHELRQSPGEGDKHEIASVEPHDPLWALGKFACAGQHWAAVQIKMLLMVFLLEFDESYPKAQRETLENRVLGEKCVPGMTQKIVLRRRTRKKGLIEKECKKSKVDKAAKILFLGPK